MLWVGIVGVADQGSRGNGPDIHRVVGKGVEDESLLTGNGDGHPVILSRRRIGGGNKFKLAGRAGEPRANAEPQYASGQYDLVRKVNERTIAIE